MSSLIEHYISGQRYGQQRELKPAMGRSSLGEWLRDILIHAISLRSAFAEYT